MTPKTQLTITWPRLLTLLVLGLTAGPLSAAEHGIFTYRVAHEQIEIINCRKDATGEASIPAMIEGRPVTTIEPTAFSGCAKLVAVIIPATVTSFLEWNIWPGNPRPATPFLDCISLTRITVDPQNDHYSSHAGILFNKEKTNLIRFPQARPGDYLIPDTVTSIGQDAFTDCSELASITIPSAVTYLNRCDFLGSTNLVDIKVEEGNPNYSSIDGVLFNADQTRLLLCPEGKSGRYIIPEGVITLAGGIMGCGQSGCIWCGGAFAGCGKLTEIRLPTTLESIGAWAFLGCTGLTSITIPHGVTNIESGAFRGCTALTSILTHEENLYHSSIDGVLFNASKHQLLHYPAGKAGNYIVPPGVSSIGGGAFEGCTELTGITIPSSVTSIATADSISSISANGFDFCTKLSRAVFLGDAPGNPNFLFSAPDFTIYYLSTSTGFTSPTWNGYPAVEIDVDQYPAAPWLLEHGLSHDTDLHQDLNSDGVTLLMAYALGLDPRQNLRGRLPGAVLHGDNLAMNFLGNAPGITYTVQTSTDLQHWTTTGVTLSDPELDGLVTASVARDRPQRFLRLVVE